MDAENAPSKPENEMQDVEKDVNEIKAQGSVAEDIENVNTDSNVENEKSNENEIVDVENGENIEDDNTDEKDLEKLESIIASGNVPLAQLDGASAITVEGSYSYDDHSESDEEDYNLIEQQQLEKALYEKQELVAVNQQLQSRLVLLVRNKSSEGQTKQATDKITMMETEKRLRSSIKNVMMNHQAVEKTQAQYDRNAMDLQRKLDEKEGKSTDISESFLEFKREIAKSAINSRTGKPIPRRIIAQFEAANAKKDEEVEKVRLRNISLRQQYKKLETKLQEREQLAEGLHLIDFEQLKIENQTWNEKIEERDEELHKLRKKTTTTVQVLTHIKEKLQFSSCESEQLREKLQVLDSQLTQKRDKLTKAKHIREKLRTEEAQLRHEQGFINNDDLVLDFEQRKNEMRVVHEQLRELKSRYEELNHQINEHKRDKLTKAKHIREKLRTEEAQLRHEQGFINNDDLVLDFEQRKNEMRVVHEQLRELKSRYEELNHQINEHKRANRMTMSSVMNEGEPDSMIL
eukprot:TRINITY_DN4345_c0_g1_i1.p1 TRINITY_DN4345_c0_g1~~TRINITY_DN4345_c0_g1_i1.p1  ORF type:complete len:519 (-),score=184.98 TRINITY_DN4345_c0_g1_i1:274-1830(-)